MRDLHEPSIEERLERIERHLFPEDFRRDPPPPPDPAEDLLGPPASWEKTYLTARFDLLVRNPGGTPAFSWVTYDEKTEWLDEYLLENGNPKYLPKRYFHPDRPGVIVDRDTGEDVTEEVAERWRRKRERADARHRVQERRDWEERGVPWEKIVAEFGE